MANDTDKSVLDFNPVTETDNETDYAYLIKSSGTDRDKKITVDNLLKKASNIEVTDTLTTTQAVVNDTLTVESIDSFNSTEDIPINTNNIMHHSGNGITCPQINTTRYQPTNFPISFVIVPLGAWNMNVYGSFLLPHTFGSNYKHIIHAYAVIHRNDIRTATNSSIRFLSGHELFSSSYLSTGSVEEINNTNIQLFRATGSVFANDSAYGGVSDNRGFIYLTFADTSSYI